MKISEFNERITKIIKTFEFKKKNNDNHVNLRIPIENYKNHENIRIAYKNHENHENLRIQRENHEKI